MAPSEAPMIPNRPNILCSLLNMDEVKKLDKHSVSGWFVCLFVFHYFVLYVYMFLCAGLGYTYTCVDMEARTQCQVSSSSVLQLCLEAGSLTQCRVDKCAVLRALAGRPCLYFPNARITSMCHHALLFFHGCWVSTKHLPNELPLGSTQAVILCSRRR